MSSVNEVSLRKPGKPSRPKPPKPSRPPRPPKPRQPRSGAEPFPVPDPHTTPKPPVRLDPPNWKEKCRTNQGWCEKWLIQVRNVPEHWKAIQVDLHHTGIPVNILSESKKLQIRNNCKKTDPENVENCFWSKAMYLMLWGGKGPYSGNSKRAANIDAKEQSTNGSLWLGVGALLLILLLAAIAAYWYLFRGGEKKKGPGVKGASKTNKSKLGGKSKISSRKSAKASLGSKSKASRHSKCAKSRRSKSSAKQK